MGSLHFLFLLLHITASSELSATAVDHLIGLGISSAGELDDVLWLQLCSAGMWEEHSTWSRQQSSVFCSCGTGVVVFSLGDSQGPCCTPEGHSLSLSWAELLLPVLLTARSMVAGENSLQCKDSYGYTRPDNLPVLRLLGEYSWPAQVWVCFFIPQQRVASV